MELTKKELEELRRKHLVETGELQAMIEAGHKDLRIVDLRGYVRTSMDTTGSQTALYLGAPEEYATAHIPGAVYIDWTEDIVDKTDPIPAQLATAEKLADVMGSAGIGDSSIIIAYDSHNASQFATRFWWALRTYGNSNVRVLDGGWQKWVREQRPVSADLPAYPVTTFTPHLDNSWRATAENVFNWLNSPEHIIIDARDEGQFSGRVRRGIRGGHIPGAKHLPREALFEADGCFKSPQDLLRIADSSAVDPNKTTVAYCNGGVAATSVLFALSMLGYHRLTNYDGSWNEWNLIEEYPVELS